MGMGATDTFGRMMASVGLGAPEISFSPSFDVVNAGVLLSLPALLAQGLLQHAEAQFSLPNGYYRLNSIFLLLSFMALARLKAVESLRYCAPGEWGKVLGVDRVPEVRTLRQKIALLAVDKKPATWAAELCQQWMKAAPEQAGALYVDGHVRVYHGRLAHLPRRYVAREKLCLRASVDYWVNAMDGQPFFFAHKDISSGLINALENDIVPRLLEEVPNQPDAETLQANPLLHRFTVIFDREGYSPELLLSLKNKRVACISYHKYPKENWSAEEFHTCQVQMASGQSVEMKVAERGTWLQKLWVREVRRQTQTGHQTSVISTDYQSNATRLAARMFARWSQENFFKYMRENFNLDRLAEYGVEEIPGAETIEVVNPEYRRLDQAVRKAQGELNRKHAEIGALTMPPLNVPAADLESFQEKKSALDECITALKEDIQKLKADRKAVPRHITLDQLPEAERFTRCLPQAKHLLDTIKMVAYRAETAMAHILKEKMSRGNDDARSLLRAIYTTEADLIPNKDEKTLTVRLHHLANRSSDHAIRHLCSELNSTETIFPDTDLQLLYEFVSDSKPQSGAPPAIPHLANGNDNPDAG